MLVVQTTTQQSKTCDIMRYNHYSSVFRPHCLQCSLTLRTACWCSYLSGLKCKWFAANATASPSSLPSLKSRTVLPFWYQLSQVGVEKRPFSLTALPATRAIPMHGLTQLGLSLCGQVIRQGSHAERLNWSRCRWGREGYSCEPEESCIR